MRAPRGGPARLSARRPAKGGLRRATLRFLGAAGTVTGSRHLLDAGESRVLLDCGLFQGLKALRLRNREAPPFDPRSIDGVVLSHAHVDHSGALPLLVRSGYRGPIFCTSATAALLRILLVDSARLQEEEAAAANRYGSSKHHPALPLYTVADVEAALDLLQRRPYHAPFEAARGVEVAFHRAGHILGAAFVAARFRGRSLVYSGDLGRWKRPILHDPDLPPAADVVVVESTYGDRLHDPGSIDDLAEAIRAGAARGGPILVPSFAVGRAQELLWTIRELEAAEKIPTLPVFVDSPMAIDVSDVYLRHTEEHDLDMRALIDERRSPFRTRRFEWVRTVAESKRLNEMRTPFLVIAGSGMATGGRIIHHLRTRLPDPRTTVLFPGYQAAGTRGRAMQQGATTVRIFGEDVPVRARVVTIDGLSAHADREDLLRWLGGRRGAPDAIWIVHGEPVAAEALRLAIHERHGWEARVAADGETADLSR
jgi:metallo-beta-lactamase family protein